jgi:hypothetical protein
MYQYASATIWKGLQQCQRHRDPSLNAHTYTYMTTAQFMSTAAGDGPSGLPGPSDAMFRTTHSGTHKLTSGMMNAFHSTAAQRIVRDQRPRLYGPGA